MEKINKSKRFKILIWIKTFSGGSYAGVSSFGITYQYYGKISDELLKIPVGYNETINLKKE